MKEKIYVFGHKNPDTDSICSAIAYANLKRQLDHDNDYEAVALGLPNKETQFVLDNVGIQAPRVIDHLKSQVSDLNLGRGSIVYENSSIMETLDKVIHQVGRAMPVVDENNHFIGVVSISDLLPMYMYKDGQDFLCESKTPFANFLEALPVELVNGKKAEGLIKGRLILVDDLLPGEVLTENDIVFGSAGSYEKGHLAEYTPGYLVLGNMTNNTLNIREGDTTTIYATEKSVYSLIRIIHKTVPIQSVVRKSNLEYFTTYETLDDVRKNMATSKYRRFPVVDENGYIMGMISRSNLLDANRKKAILVDHNEKGQSIEGIEDVSILEVIDHHRVADIQTMGPLYFRVEPVGCTCTIVAKMYEENNVPINKEMAQILLSAILSDTLIFKSPTCTETDRLMGRKLAEITGLDPQMYGMSMIYAGSDLENATPYSILTTDMKRFMFGNRKVIITQTNTSDFDGFFSMYQDIMEEMDKLIVSEEANLFVLLVTDVIVGGTEMIASGDDKWIAEQAFKMDTSENSVFLPGVFSRKKQVVPKLMQAASL